MKPLMYVALLLVFSKPLLAEDTNDPNSTRKWFVVESKSDRLVIQLRKQPIAEFVYADSKIRRPFFANLRTPGGLQVTRNHPPVAGTDPVDHDTMHPGIWLGFGDIGGVDFWRNRGRIEHLRIAKSPDSNDDRLTFSTASRLVTPDGQAMCRLFSQFRLTDLGRSWRLDWEATFHSADHDLTFGDEEEMGFGARVATPLTEKNGGLIISSTGRKTASATWGQTAEWCDYSGRIGGRTAGITLMAAPDNFGPSWWHNRDYGLFVANPFGRAAMKQGAPSIVTVKKGEPFRLCFAAVIHEDDYTPADAYQQFKSTARIENSLKPKSGP